VLILGGGCAGVATAWALSRTPALRRRFEVTLVQSGWRLGGKGATGRDPARGHAVLEHGLHLWLGFYREAFAMMCDLYDSWTRPPEGPLRTLETAFRAVHEVTLLGEGRCWHVRFPELPGRPWDAFEPLSWPSVLARWAKSLPEALRASEPGGRALAVALTATILRGLTREQLRWGEHAWTRMDEEDLRAWLRRHGASEAEVRSPPIAALYDLGFAYPDGRPSVDSGSAAAGVALRVLVQIFAGYRGAPFWRMSAGMGDTVFVPAWDVLRERGVRFRLFHQLVHLGLRGRSIARVELGVQARVDDDYDPLIRVGPLRAWPSAPNGERLRERVAGTLDGDRSAALETLSLHAGEHFDAVVLAIPSTAHHHFAAELIAANPRYAAMVEHSHAVATIAAQWWLTRTPTQLGWPGRASIVTGVDGSLRTWADMSEVLDAEAWPDRPASLAHFCGVAPPDIATLRDGELATVAAGEHLRDWELRSLPKLWPGTATLGGRFDAGVTHARYVRANVADWERYVLSLPGTIRHRLAPDQSGFDNLYLAGDWTHNVVNGGSVEGAVSSGIAAAEAIVHA
jgi:uncharacterized protein with NAD-binding domain and iron-sulfur cluster